MPHYRHTGTGNEGDFTPEFVALYPEGTYEELGESVAEKSRRLVAEALENKVDLELDDDAEGVAAQADPKAPSPDASKTASPVATQTKRSGSESTTTVRKESSE